MNDADYSAKKMACRWGELYDYFWVAFATLPESDPERVTAESRWQALSAQEVRLIRRAGGE